MQTQSYVTFVTPPRFDEKFYLERKKTYQLNAYVYIQGVSKYTQPIIIIIIIYNWDERNCGDLEDVR